MFFAFTASRHVASTSSLRRASSIAAQRTLMETKGADAAPATPSSPLVAVIVGCGSKHDLDGADAELPPESRWGLGGALAMRFAAAGLHTVCMSRRPAVRDEVSRWNDDCVSHQDILGEEREE